MSVSSVVVGVEVELQVVTLYFPCHLIIVVGVEVELQVARERLEERRHHQPLA